MQNWKNYIIIFLLGVVTIQAYRLSHLREENTRYKIAAEQQQAAYKQKKARVAINLAKNNRMMHDTMTRPFPNDCEAVMAQMTQERY